MTTDVVLVDDVDIERKLVRMAVERSGRFRVVGEGADGGEAVDCCAWPATPSTPRPPYV